MLKGKPKHPWLLSFIAGAATGSILIIPLILIVSSQGSSQNDMASQVPGTRILRNDDRVIELPAGPPIYGDACGIDHSELTSFIAAPHESTKGKARFLFRQEWMTMEQLKIFFGGVAHEQKPPSCFLVSVKGDPPCEDKECIVTLRARPGSGDIHIVTQLFEWNWDGFVSKMQPTTILDAGANAGFASVLFSIQYPGATIVSVELDESNYRMLRLNTGPLGNVFPVRAGLFNRITKMAIVNGSDDEHKEYGYKMRTVEDARTRLKLSSFSSVTTVTVDMLSQLFGMDGFDFVKIDIEGSEVDVFSPTEDGSYDPLSWISKSRMVSIELHERKRIGCKKAVADAFSKAKGFKRLKSGEYSLWKRT